MSLSRRSTSAAVPAPRPPRGGAGSLLRRGMTLVELLVVLFIISVLSSLTLSGLLVARNRGKVAKTAATVRKLSELILPYYEQYENRRPRLGIDLAALRNVRGGRQIEAECRRIAIRRLMAIELPDRVTDIADAFANGRATIFRTKVGGQDLELADIPPVTRRYASLIAGNAAVSSAELLHVIVTRGPVADPDVIAHFRDDEFGDFDRDGLKEFVDGWGMPIAFQRWPVGFPSPLQPITGSLGDVDERFASSGHRLLPLIYSPGPDTSYDVMDETSARLSQLNYNPFDPGFRAGHSPSGPLNGEIFLAPVAQGSVECYLPQILGSGGLPSGAFQTIGSPRDTTGPRQPGSTTITPANGKLEFLDNVHNHDLIR